MTPELAGQTVVLIGGSAGIGLETARRARAEGADVILTGRDPGRLEQAAASVGAARTAAFDATDSAALAAFFRSLDAPIGHVLVTAAGPRYAPLLEMDADQVRDVLSDHVALGLDVARNAVGKMRPGGTLLFMGGTGGRRVGHGLGIVSAATAALPPFVGGARARDRAGAGQPDRGGLRRHAAVGVAARRQARRAQGGTAAHAADRPGGGPADVAALAVHLMVNTALTGATYDIDGGQQFVW